MGKVLHPCLIPHTRIMYLCDGTEIYLLTMASQETSSKEIFWSPWASNSAGSVFCFESACQETKLIFKYSPRAFKLIDLRSHAAAFCMWLWLYPHVDKYAWPKLVSVVKINVWWISLSDIFQHKQVKIFKKQSAVMEFFVFGGRWRKWKLKILSLINIIFSDSHTKKHIVCSMGALIRKLIWYARSYYIMQALNTQWAMGIPGMRGEG